MTIDAMHWVWTHSRSTGNPRMVLLAVADKVQDARCVTGIGTTEFRARLGGVSKSVVVRAVDKALTSGELVMIEEARGTRAAVYQLPHAVAYTRPTPGSTGPDSRPMDAPQGDRIETPGRIEGYRIETGSEDARGLDSGPGRYRIEPPSGTDSGPLNQTTPTRSESKQAGAPAPVDLGPGIPTAARPLVDALTTAGVLVRWNLSASEWSVVEALIARTGVPALAAFAQRQASAREISFAKYFLPGWRELPPLPAPSSVRPAVPAQQRGPVPPARHAASAPGGWQPYTNPVDPSVYENGF
ncbi:hypothetical protein ACWCPT_14800 [Streptomyces sp. NPDC002308]